MPPGVAKTGDQGKSRLRRPRFFAYRRCERLLKFDRAFERKDYKKVAKFGELILEKDFTDARTHTLKAFAHEKLNQTDKSYVHFIISFKLKDSLLQTGDGLSPETAWHVYQVKEEYHLLWSRFFNVIGQSLIRRADKSYEMLRCKSSTGEISTFYFDITDIMQRNIRVFDKRK